METTQQEKTQSGILQNFLRRLEQQPNMPNFEVIEKAFEARGAIVIPVSGGTDSLLLLWACTEVALRHADKGWKVHAWVRDNGLLHGGKAGLRWLRDMAAVDETLGGNYGPRFLEIHVEQTSGDVWVGAWKHAKEKKAVLASSRNRTEQHFASYSLTSRMASIYPLIGMWKTEVLKACEQIGVHENAIKSSRLADPGCGRGADYEAVGVEEVDAHLDYHLAYEFAPDIEIKGSVRAAEGNGMFLAPAAEYVEREYEAGRWKREMEYVRG